LFIRKKRTWESRIVDIGDLGKEVDVPSATGKSPNYRYIRAMKLPLGLKELFDNPPKEKN
jgi:hypothetical protein